MKTIQITSKTSMIVPDQFTMKELYDANIASFPDTPYDKAYPTINARVKSLIDKGVITQLDPKEWKKSSPGRGRVAIVYSLTPDDKKSGILVPVVSVTSNPTVAETLTVPVEMVKTASETVSEDPSATESVEPVSVETV